MIWKWIERDSATFYMSLVGFVTGFVVLAIGLSYGIHLIADRHHHRGYYDVYYDNNRTRQHWHHRHYYDEEERS